METSPAKVRLLGTDITVTLSPRGSKLEGKNLFGMDLWKSLGLRNIDWVESSFVAKFDPPSLRGPVSGADI